MIILTLILLISTTLATKSVDCESVSFEFNNSIWSFPSTVGQADEAHKLKYLPPGYYYLGDSATCETILAYHAEGGDFANEYQPRKTLYPRLLHSYIFRFKEGRQTYDSLMTAIEKSYGRKFVLTRGIKDNPLVRPDNKTFEYNFLTINECLTIGIKRSSPRQKHRITF